MQHKNIALFWKLYVLLAREDGLPGTGVGNQAKLVKFTRGNWKWRENITSCQNLFNMLCHCRVTVMILSQFRNSFLLKLCGRLEPDGSRHFQEEFP